VNKRKLKKYIKRLCKYDIPISTVYQVSGKRNENGIPECFEIIMVPMFELNRFYGGGISNGIKKDMYI